MAKIKMVPCDSQRCDPANILFFVLSDSFHNSLQSFYNKKKKKK